MHLLALNVEDAQVIEAAESLYDSLRQAGLETLYDDREESAGVKFNDADLMGFPVRVVVSPRNLRQGSAEVKLRRESDAELVALEGVTARVKELLELS